MILLHSYVFICFHICVCVEFHRERKKLICIFFIVSSIFLFSLFWNYTLHWTLHPLSMWRCVFASVTVITWSRAPVSPPPPSPQRGSTALIIQNSQRMLTPVYTHHNKLHSPPSLLPHQVLPCVCLTASSHSLLQQFLFRTFHYAFLRGRHTVKWEATV